MSRRVESSRVFESVSSYILALQPSSLFPMIIRSVLFSTPSTAQRASRMSECAPLTRSLWGYYFLFSPSLLCLFLFDISCVVFLGKEVRERKHDGHFPNGVDVCVIWSDRTAVSLLHCCCISDPFGGSLIIVSLSLCVCAAAIYLHLSLVFCLPSRRVGTDLVWRR